MKQSSILPTVFPTPAEFKQLRIWDSYFTPAFSNPGLGYESFNADVAKSERAISMAQIEKLCYFAHVGLGTTMDSELEALLQSDPEHVLKPLERWPDRFIALIQLNAKRPEESLAAIDRWIANGPMLGAYLPGGGPAAVNCLKQGLIPIIERLTQLNAVIMQHTWFKTGGKQSSGESTPEELARLAKDFPEQVFLCAHAGGEWEKGIRAVRDVPNVWVETSGFDATAGFIEMGLREIGPERIVFGSHLPSRSLGTELMKVLSAVSNQQHRKQILGENFRKLVKLSLLRKSKRSD